MNRVAGKVRPVIIEAAAFGRWLEDLWTHILKEKLIFAPRAELDAYLDKEFKERGCVKSKEKFLNGFETVYSFFKDYLHPDYTIQEQLRMRVPLGPLQLTGDSDYILFNPDIEKPIILECKGTYKKDSFATVSDQVRHYAYLYLKLYGILPQETIIFYGRVGAVERFTYTREELVAYKNQVVKDFMGFYQKDTWETTPTDKCFLCPYTYTCLKQDPSTYESPVIEGLSLKKGELML